MAQQAERTAGVLPWVGQATSENVELLLAALLAADLMMVSEQQRASWDGLQVVPGYRPILQDHQ